MIAVTFEESLKNIENPTESETFTIYKADEDKRLVFGWASVALTVDGEEIEDRQHDMIDPDDLEEAAYEYVLNFRDTGEEHLEELRKKGRLVESCVLTKEKQKAMGIPEGVLPVAWWIGFKIDDDDTWERVKNGTYKMFSIEGKATREPVQKSEEPTGCGVLIIQDGKVLTGTRKERASHGLICGPGGHIEPGETPEEAAKRETIEEFGIECNELIPLGIQDGGRYGSSAIFMCSDFSGFPKTDEKEMTSPKWTAPGEITESGAYPPFMQSLSLLPKQRTAKSFDEVLKFNPYHDSRGRFSSSNSYAYFTTHTKDPAKQHWADMAVARQKKNTPGAGVYTPPKPKVNYDSKGFADHDDADFHQLYNRKNYYKQQQLTPQQQKACDDYVNPSTEPGSLYNVAQNINWDMANGNKLSPKHQKIYDNIESAAHNVGYNVNLTRYDHAEMINGVLNQLGAGNDYTKMSLKQLQKTLVGQSFGENKLISTTTNDFANAPRTVQNLFKDRAVKINYKTKADVQGVLMPIGGGGDQGEMVLMPTTGVNKTPKITAVRSTGNTVYRNKTGKYYPQIEIDVEWD